MMNANFKAHCAAQRIACPLPRCNSAHLAISNTLQSSHNNNRTLGSSKKISSTSLTSQSRSSFQSRLLAMAAAPETASRDATSSPSNKTLLCTSLTAPTVQGMLQEAQEALAARADIVELRLDYLEQFDPEADLPVLLKGCPLPAIVTYRPSWEGGKYTGDEAPRLATLKYAATLGAAFIDIELKIAHIYFASQVDNDIDTPTRIIVSSHDYQATPSEEELFALVRRCREVGADVVKFATTATNITDALTVLRVLSLSVKDGPVIALAMAERGQITRILAPKYGGFLTFGALSPERQSAPGQPTLDQLRDLYRLPSMSAHTAVYGIIGNPVKHSKSPAIHNPSFHAIQHDAVYVPLLVDSLPEFIDAIHDIDDTVSGGSSGWEGFSVTIPHKEAALKCARDADPVAEAIGAANTLVRQSSGDGGYKAYNSDWIAAITAIEKAMITTDTDTTDTSPLKGKTVVVLGAGGAGRALAFGAATKGATVIIANRSVDRAESLASQLPGSIAARGVSLDAVANGEITGDVLVNTTSVGMSPKDEESPVSAEVLRHYEVVFDAVYTPIWTLLLRDAKEAGCRVVTGDEMFVGQAAVQFEWFTGKEAPVELMREIVLGKK